MSHHIPDPGKMVSAHGSVEAVAEAARVLAHMEGQGANNAE